MVCPDGGTCADGQTCCNSGTGGYDCCPNANGVCCGNDKCCSADYPVCCNDSDGCCPAGYSCAGSLCVLSKEDHPLQGSFKPKVLNVYCPDGGECKDGQTCCSAGEGEYACCPELNGVCCSDMKHCCPSGYQCGTTNCLKTGSNFPLLQLIGRREKEKSPTIVCPDGGTCKDGQTCCSEGGGSYGCCPNPGAVCCSDMTHCCPEGYSCGTTNCFKAGAGHPLLKLVGYLSKPQKDIL